MLQVRAFNELGLALFARHVTALRSNDESSINMEQLLDSKYSTEYGHGNTVDDKFRFENLYDIGQHLVSCLPEWSWKDAMEEEKAGLWSWLSALYFQDLHQPTKTSRCNNKLWCFIPEQDFQCYYRHKLRLAYAMLSSDKMEPGFAKWLLENQKSTQYGATLEDTVAYNQNLSSRTLQKFILQHYKTENGGIKKNTSSKWKNAPDPSQIKGNLRRLNVSLKRISTVADVEDMETLHRADMWGSEYSESNFKPQNSHK